VNWIPIPGTTLAWLSNSATRVTRPESPTGNSSMGSWRRIFTSVPTGRGARVLMNIPPWLMLVAQSVRKLPTLR